MTDKFKLNLVTKTFNFKVLDPEDVGAAFKALTIRVDKLERSLVKCAKKDTVKQFVDTAVKAAADEGAKKVEALQATVDALQATVEELRAKLQAKLEEGKGTPSSDPLQNSNEDPNVPLFDGKPKGNDLLDKALVDAALNALFTVIAQEAEVTVELDASSVLYELLSPLELGESSSDLHELIETAGAYLNSLNQGIADAEKAVKKAEKKAVKKAEKKSQAPEESSNSTLVALQAKTQAKAQAKAQAKLAKAQAKFDEAQAKFDEAQAKFDEAQAKLDEFKAERSRVSGVVESIACHRHDDTPDLSLMAMDLRAIEALKRFTSFKDFTEEAMNECYENSELIARLRGLVSRE